MKSKFALEDDYPYYGQNDYCKHSKFTYDKFEIVDTCKVKRSVKELKKALLEGPVAVTVDVPESFLFYVGGVYNDPACQKDF